MKFNPKEFFSKRHILNNIGLKIISVLVAIILWILVINITDPLQTRTFRNVPVRLVNTTVVGSNKTVRVLKHSDVVSEVVVRAPRSIIGQLGTSSDNIIATADFSNLSADNKTVPISFTTFKYSDRIDNIKSNNDKLLVEIEDKKTIQLPIQVTTSGSIASGYIKGKVSLGQNQVRVSGPESVVSLVKSASVDVQLTDFTENISTVSDIILFDVNGNTVPDDELTLSVESISVDVEILATKKVPIRYDTIGSPADGYALTGEIKCTPETVVIAGPTNSIASVTQIEIPATELNVTGQTDTLTAVLDIENYLPEGIRLVEDPNNNGKVQLSVYIEALHTNTYGIYLQNVKMQNLPEGFTAEWAEAEDNVEFTLEGLTQDFEKLQISSLNYRVDFIKHASDYAVSEYKPGTYQLDLILDLPAGITQKEKVRLKIHLDKKEGEGRAE
ncbi:MAG: hypothetical protein K5796_10395 [Lachnospiraceae bacterium]|nr:hypothetical protein [Lachnospiraceae bacterium]